MKDENGIDLNEWRQLERGEQIKPGDYVVGVFGQHWSESTVDHHEKWFVVMMGFDYPYYRKREKEMSLKIEAGKFYELRNGEKAEVIAKRGDRWIGVRFEDGETLAEDWELCGQYNNPEYGESELDIVSEWPEWVDVDPTKITLDMLPIEARFRDQGQPSWIESRLMGCKKFEDLNYFVDVNGDTWDFCQVRNNVDSA